MHEGHKGTCVNYFTNILSIYLISIFYLTYLGDGDSKGYKAVCNSQPYGSDVEIEKAECVGHVQKRMGSQLRALSKSNKGVKLSDGKGIGDRGRLSNAEIDKLQLYYGKAIRDNYCSSFADMKKAIWAIYLHKSSTDSKPNHILCPKGETSWCGYNKSIGNGGTAYLHRHSLPETVMQKIKPVFKDLSNEVLLRKCVLGKTQNANESFNAIIWKRIPKTIFVGSVALNIGISDAVITFNSGAMGRIDVLKELGLKVSENTVKVFRDIDRKRIATAESRMTQASSNERKKKRQVKRKLEDNEDDGSYGPGMF